MRYFIVSEEQLQILISFSTTLGLTQNSEQWTEEKELKIIDMIEKHRERFKEIPDELDMIVGYSTPNPNEVKIWHRTEEGILESTTRL